MHVAVWFLFCRIADQLMRFRIFRYATVAQQVEQLTRNEQVVRSNRIGSSSCGGVAQLVRVFA